MHAVQQTEDYIMSQQPYIVTASTLATKTLFCSRCIQLKIAPCYMYVKALLQMVETRHCHTEVSPLKTVPQSDLGKCLLNRSHPN